jgi:nucleoside-triphosphatase
LGFLVKDARAFQRAIYAAVDGAVPIFGVLRLAEIPWHQEILAHHQVTLQEVNKDNRDALPEKLATLLLSALQRNP